MKKNPSLCGSEVLPVKHWCYLSYTALVKAHSRRALCCKGDWASGAENHTAIEKILSLLGYFSVPFLSAIYNDISQSTFPPVTTSADIAPAFGEAVVAAKPFPGLAEFRLCGGAAATPSSSATSALRHRMSFH